jgi:hypothetical protein
MLLLTTVARGARGGNGALPTRQWVLLQLEEEGIDGESALTGLPSWGPNGYRCIYQSADPSIDPDTGLVTSRLGLTFCGRHHVGDEWCSIQNHVFLAALVAAEANQAKLRGGSPFQPIKMTLPATETATTVSIESGYRCSVTDLVRLFGSEPPTWSIALNTVDDHWNTSGAVLRPFRAVKSSEAYLSVLDELMMSQNPLAPVAALPPMALPEALDHLDLAWRLVMNGPLIHTRRLSRGAVLTQPANSADEFDARCSALKDILDQMKVAQPDVKGASQWKSLSRIEYHLVRLAPTETESINRAIKALRDVAAIRDSQQHDGLVGAASEARLRLGLSRFGGNWSHDWNVVRTSTIEAVGVLREILVSTLPV